MLTEFSYVKVYNTIFRNNISNDGAIKVWGYQPVFQNITVYNNSSQSKDPNFKAIQCNDSETIIINSIVVNNIGYGISVDRGNPSISFSTFWDNTSSNFSNCPVFVGSNVTTTANGDSCDAYNNIKLDPQFVDPEHGDFRLKDTSPCIGTGSSENAPLTDILGNPRGNPPDMGAYENQSDAPYVRITSPNGGETWNAGTAHTITWTSSGTANVKIEYSKNNGSSWTTIAASVLANTGSYSWTVPNSPSLNCKVRISDTMNGFITDSSDTVFKILADLVLFMPFNSGAVDESGYGYTSTLSGSPQLTADRFGKANSAYYFDGSSSIEVNNTGSLNFNRYSICAWVKYSTLKGVIVSKHRK